MTKSMVVVACGHMDLQLLGGLNVAKVDLAKLNVTGVLALFNILVCLQRTRLHPGLFRSLGLSLGPSLGFCLAPL